MCGLVAFIGQKPDLGLLTAAAAQAARRGPHSHGWAWPTVGGSWARRVGLGALPAPPDVEGVLIGHSRLATCGDAPGDTPPLNESQPFTSGTSLVAHNGTVTNPAKLTDLHFRVDSEAILDALTRGAGIEATMTRIGRAPQALIVAYNPSTVFAVRQAGSHRPAHPLWQLEASEGRYVCSRPFDPRCRPLPEGVTRL